MLIAPNLPNLRVCSVLINYFFYEKYIQREISRFLKARDEDEVYTMFIELSDVKSSSLSRLN